MTPWPFTAAQLPLTAPRAVMKLSILTGPSSVIAEGWIRYDYLRTAEEQLRALRFVDAYLGKISRQMRPFSVMVAAPSPFRRPTRSKNRSTTSVPHLGARSGQRHHRRGFGQCTDCRNRQQHGERPHQGQSRTLRRICRCQHPEGVV